MAKRARERAREERQETKRLRREALASEPQSSHDGEELMERFRVLSEQYAVKAVSEAHYQEERRRIFELLGIEE